MTEADSEPIFKNINYTLTTRGSNNSEFFKLPPNTRIFIPVLNSKASSNIDTECIFTKLNLIKFDPTCSNIDRILQEFLRAQAEAFSRSRSSEKKIFKYKIYDSNLGIETCPNIDYALDDETLKVGLNQCPTIVKQTYLKDYLSVSARISSTGWKSAPTSTWRKEGETLVINNVDEKINSFQFECKQAGIIKWHDLIEHPKLKKDMIASLLLKPIQSELLERDYFIYWDESRYTSMKNLCYHIIGQDYEALQYQTRLSLRNIIMYLRSKINKEFGSDYTITIVTFACNNLPPDKISAYEEKDKGIDYETFKKLIHLQGDFTPRTQQDIDRTFLESEWPGFWEKKYLKYKNKYTNLKN
jgi:hypothetical protein